jgi:RNA polymerase sigma factor (sigma-70 family)
VLDAEHELSMRANSALDTDEKAMATAKQPDTQNQETMVLIERHRNGEREALDELFQRYSKRVHRIVCIRMGAFLRSRAEVEDVVQATLLRAFQSLDKFQAQKDARLIDWMARIAENSLRDLFQHEVAGKRDAYREVPMENLRDKIERDSRAWDPAADTSTPAEKVSAAEMELIVDECLTELPEEQREIILLVDFANGDWDFVLEKTGRPSIEAAQKFHRRARVALAEKVGRRM